MDCKSWCKPSSNQKHIPLLKGKKLTISMDIIDTLHASIIISKVCTSYRLNFDTPNLMKRCSRYIIPFVKSKNTCLLLQSFKT